MSANLTPGLFRILNPDGGTAGAAFLLSDDGLLVTCSHVVLDCIKQRQGDAKPESVSVVSFETGERYEAHIEPILWRGCEKEDVAFLRIDIELPKHIKTLILGSSAGTDSHVFQTYGFPEMARTQGLAGNGNVNSAIRDENGNRLLQLTSTTVTAGFSGAPIYDTLTQRVIGMVTAITSPDRYGRLEQTAFAVPSETLRAICQDLQISEICPYRSLDPFTEADSEFFFGREQAVDRLTESLKRELRFLAILGPSGSGKSSLVQAGLIPQLRKGAIPGSVKWGIVVSRPASQPFEQLASAGMIGAANEDLISASKRWLNKHSSQTRLVLIIDQFEELMVTCNPVLRQSFSSQLLRLSRSKFALTAAPN